MQRKLLLVGILSYALLCLAHCRTILPKQAPSGTRLAAARLARALQQEGLQSPSPSLQDGETSPGLNATLSPPVDTGSSPVDGSPFPTESSPPPSNATLFTSICTYDPSDPVVLTPGFGHGTCQLDRSYVVTTVKRDALSDFGQYVYDYFKTTTGCGLYTDPAACNGDELCTWSSEYCVWKPPHYYDVDFLQCDGSFDKASSVCYLLNNTQDCGSVPYCEWTENPPSSPFPDVPSPDLPSSPQILSPGISPDISPGIEVSPRPNPVEISPAEPTPTGFCTRKLAEPDMAWYDDRYSGGSATWRITDLAQWKAAYGDCKGAIIKFYYQLCYNVSPYGYDGLPKEQCVQQPQCEWVQDSNGGDVFHGCIMRKEAIAATVYGGDPILTELVNKCVEHSGDMAACNSVTAS